MGDSLADLPLLLLGPILRRVEPRQVSVFVATHQPATVARGALRRPGRRAAPPPEFAAADAHTSGLPPASTPSSSPSSSRTPPPLQPAHLYSYDLRITPDGGAAQSLKDLGLLEDDDAPRLRHAAPASEEVEIDAIGYAENRLPSFVTCPAVLEELVLAHASCRKPHGDGHPAMQWLDSYVDDLDGATDGRPHMLFLTGDQIYADDVAARYCPGSRPSVRSCSAVSSRCPRRSTTPSRSR